MSDRRIGFRRNTLPRFSEFVSDPQSTERHWLPFDLSAIEPDETDTLYEVQQSDRIDRLASRFYADDRLKWVIMAANGFTLAEIDLIPGRQIRIPTRQRVSKIAAG